MKMISFNLFSFAGVRTGNKMFLAVFFLRLKWLIKIYAQGETPCFRLCYHVVFIFMSYTCNRVACWLLLTTSRAFVVYIMTLQIKTNFWMPRAEHQQSNSNWCENIYTCHSFCFNYSWRWHLHYGYYCFQIGKCRVGS